MGGGSRGVEWGREEGGCHVSMWKIFFKSVQMGVANGPKDFFTVGSVIFFLCIWYIQFIISGDIRYILEGLKYLFKKITFWIF